MAALAMICFADNKQQEGAALIEQAKQLSDIRGTGGSAFHLKATISLHGEKGINEGTYTEFWVSGSLWRRETVEGDFHRVEVASGKQRWVLDSTKEVLPDANEPEQALTVWKIDPDRWTVGTIRDRALDGGVLRCLETKPNAIGGKSALCFDKATGALVMKVADHPLRDRIADKTCQFGDYQKFGTKTFPHLIRCFDDGKLKLEVRVTELNAVDNLAAELFAQPDGAQETVNCQGFAKPPKAIYQPLPTPPSGKTPKYPVLLLVKVGKDGKPLDITVVRSADKDFDGAAMDAVRRWKFKPAECDGEPIETEINVEIVFRVGY